MINVQRFDEICDQAVKYFGCKHQITKTIEELAELQIALSRYLNLEPDDENIAEEIADVFIMLNQLCIVFGQEKVKTAFTAKMERLEKRIEK